MVFSVFGGIDEQEAGGDRRQSDRFEMRGIERGGPSFEDGTAFFPVSEIFVADEEVDAFASGVDKGSDTAAAFLDAIEGELREHVATHREVSRFIATVSAGKISRERSTSARCTA